MVSQILLELEQSFGYIVSMSSKFPFIRNDPFSVFSKREQALADIIKNVTTLGPLVSDPTSLGYITEANKLMIVQAAALMRDTAIVNVLKSTVAPSASKMALLKTYASPDWMSAIQATARRINLNPPIFLQTQKAFLAATAPEWTRLSNSFAAYQPIISNLLAASDWGERARVLSEQLAPGLENMKIATESAIMIDTLTLRAKPDSAGASSTAIVTQQVLEAHRLIQAIGQSQDADQGADLITALVMQIAAIILRFRENTIKEISGIGAIKVFELFMVVVAFLQLVIPPEMPAAEKKAIAEVKAELRKIEDYIQTLLTAQELAHEAIIADLPRAELIRTVPIRRYPQGKAQILMRGDKGMQLAIKEKLGKWRLIIYRDPLTDQLSEGWVYGPAIQPFDGAQNK